MAICPNCGSGNLKSLHMVHASGMSNGVSKSRGVGISLGGIGLGMGKTKSFNQSILSASCAPPKKSRASFFALAAIIAFVWLPLFGKFLEAFQEPKIIYLILNVIIIGFLLCATSYGMVLVYKKLNNQHLNDEKIYAKTWLCMDCGQKIIK